MSGKTPLWKWARANARIRNEYVYETIAEFLGTFVLCLFAVGASAQHTLMVGESFLVPVVGGIFGLMIAVTVFGGASGAQINPAVSLGLAIAGELSWAKLPLYWFAQMFGGYLGAGLAFALYRDALCVSGGSVCHEAVGIFSTVVHTQKIGTGMSDQIVATAILMVAIMAAIDPNNMRVPRHLFGIYFALVVGAVTCAFGVNAGGVMNPARDLGPRLMAVSLGHSSDVIFKTSTTNEHYWLVPLFGPLIGAAVGSIMYIFLVGAHLKDADESKGPVRPAESGDWRSTVFIPKANPPPPQTPVAANNPYGSGGPYTQNGLNNNGYVRDGPRPIY